MATKDETGRGFGKRNVYVIYGENEMSARMLEVSLFCTSRNGAPSRKGCVVNGQMTKASNKRVRPPPHHLGKTGTGALANTYDTAVAEIDLPARQSKNKHAHTNPGRQDVRTNASDIAHQLDPMPKNIKKKKEHNTVMGTQGNLHRQRRHRIVTYHTHRNACNTLSRKHN